MHHKRTSMPKSWPLARKGNAYFLISSHDKTSGIPIVVALRDILKMADTHKEVRLMTMNKEVKVNGKARINEKFPIKVFDVLSLEKAKKNFRLEIVGKKVNFVEIKESETKTKTVKITGKKVLSKDKIQINLADGSNYLEKRNFAVGDSVVLNLKENKIDKIISFKQGEKVLVISGKHSGKKGTIKEINVKNNRQENVIKLNDGEVVLPSKTLLVVE